MPPSASDLAPAQARYSRSCAAAAAGPLAMIVLAFFLPFAPRLARRTLFDVVFVGAPFVGAALLLFVATRALMRGGNPDRQKLRMALAGVVLAAASAVTGAAMAIAEGHDRLFFSAVAAGILGVASAPAVLAWRRAGWARFCLLLASHALFSSTLLAYVVAAIVFGRPEEVGVGGYFYLVAIPSVVGLGLVGARKKKDPPSPAGPREPSLAGG